MEILKSLKSPRNITADYHLAAAVEWLDLGERENLHSPLVYSALEFRNCLERVAFELLILYRGGQLTEEDERAADKIGNIIRYIVELNGPLHLLEKKMLFTKCVMEESGIDIRIAVFDVGKITKYWQICSEYCHKFLKTKNSWENPEFVKNGYAKLNETKTYLYSILNGHNRSNLTITDPDVLHLEKEFLDRNIDEASVRMRAKLMQPVLRQRMFYRSLN